MADHETALAKVFETPGLPYHELADRLEAWNDAHDAEFEDLRDQAEDLIKACVNTALQSYRESYQLFRELMDSADIRQLESMRDALFRLHAALFFLTGNGAPLKITLPETIAEFWESVERSGDGEPVVIVRDGKCIFVEDLVKFARKVVEFERME
jgi:hypothetical protein